MPEFEKNQEYVLFVENDKDKICPLRGAHQGSFKIKPLEAASGIKHVFDHHDQKIVDIKDKKVIKAPTAVSSLSKPAVISSSGEPAQLITDSISASLEKLPLTLEEFKEHIQKGMTQ
jgi:hypothetical protein